MGNLQVSVSKCSILLTSESRYCDNIGLNAAIFSPNSLDDETYWYNLLPAIAKSSGPNLWQSVTEGRSSSAKSSKPLENNWTI